MQVILLIIAVSVDVFVACVACGSEQIKIGSAAAYASARSAVEY